MKIKITNSKITVSGKTVIDNRGKEDVVLHNVIKCQCGHLLDERFPSELINKKCGDCGGVL